MVGSRTAITAQQASSQATQHTQVSVPVLLKFCCCCCCRLATTAPFLFAVVIRVALRSAALVVGVRQARGEEDPGGGGGGWGAGRQKGQREGVEQAAVKGKGEGGTQASMGVGLGGKQAGAVSSFFSVPSQQSVTAVVQACGLVVICCTAWSQMPKEVASSW